VVYFFLSPTLLVNRFLSTISLYGSCCFFDLVASFAPKPGCFFWFGCFFFQTRKSIHKINRRAKMPCCASISCLRRVGADAEALPQRLPGKCRVCTGQRPLVFIELCCSREPTVGKNVVRRR